MINLNHIELEIINKIAQEMMIRESCTIMKELYNNKTVEPDFEEIKNKVLDEFAKPNGISHAMVSQRFRSKKDIDDRDLLAQQRIKMWYEKRPDLVDKALDKVLDFCKNIREKLGVNLWIRKTN